MRGVRLPALWTLGLVATLAVAVYARSHGSHHHHQAAHSEVREERSQDVAAIEPASASASMEVKRWRPTSRAGALTILDKGWFTTGYDESKKNPAWVVYEVSGPISHPGPEPTRPSVFQTDFATSAHVSHHDFSRFGYDRGHMCPAYAEWSRHGESGFLATFVCSNIIPQPHPVNAGVWEDIETAIAGRWSDRQGGWGERFGQVTVINGPIYDAHPDHFKSGIVIPTIDYSIVIRHTAAGYAALAFEVPNVAGPRLPIRNYLVSIKKIEADAGLDFFTGETASFRVDLEDALADQVW